MIKGSNPKGREIFSPIPTSPGSHPVYCIMGMGSTSTMVKRLGRDIDRQPPFNAEVEERVDLYPYFPSGPLWPVLVWILPELCSTKMAVNNSWNMQEKLCMNKCNVLVINLFIQVLNVMYNKHSDQHHILLPGQICPPGSKNKGLKLVTWNWFT